MHVRPPQIVAFGGGGFSMEWGNPLLDDFVLSLTGVERPKVCFLPTASGDADHYVVRFYRAFGTPRCDPSHISLFRRETGVGDPLSHLLAQDLIYVGGGSLVSLLGTWRAHGIDVVLHRAWRAGVVLCGGSAGSLCWFSDALSSFHEGAPRRLQGLGFLPWSNAVHYTDEPGRQSAFLDAIGSGMAPGYGVGDGAALHFVGTDLAEVVSSVPGARARYVSTAADGAAFERELAVRYPRRAGRLRSGRRGAGGVTPPPARGRGACAERGRPSSWPRMTASDGDQRRILAMGGGGFTMADRSDALDRLILTLTGKPVPKVCFLPTASGDPREQSSRFYERFSAWPCEPSILSLFHLARDRVDPRDHLLAQDAVYVGGGSMRNMLAVWREHGVDQAMRRAWERGIVLAGLSAGAMCWFAGGITRSGGRPAPVDGLGLLEGSLSVHLDSEPERLPVFRAAVASGALATGYAADDGAALLFAGTRLQECVSSSPGARVVRVLGGDGGETSIQPLPVRLLPAASACPPEEGISELRALRAGRHRWD